MGLLLNVKPSMYSMKATISQAKTKWGAVSQKVPEVHTGLGDVHVLKSKKRSGLVEHLGIL